MSYQKEVTGSVLEYIKGHFEGKLVTEARSATGNWLGFTLESVEAGKAVLSMPVRKEMTNPFGGIHGGMMSTLCDEAIGWAVVSMDLAEHFTSINLNVDFLYAAREGDVITATSSVVRQGKKVIHAEVHVHNSSGKLLAKASSNLVTTGMKVQ
jgi:uncharacterized protein (TIGR00369 family)